MSVDCDPVCGYGVVVTEDIVDKMVQANLFTKEQWEDDSIACLAGCGFVYGESGSYYTGETTIYLFANGSTLPELVEGGKDLLCKLADIGVFITLGDIKEICEVLWS